MSMMRIAPLLACLAASGGAFAQEARDRCAPEDVSQGWLLTMTRGKQPETCIVRISKAGKIAGACTESVSGLQVPVTGRASLDNLCLVTGDFVLGDIEDRERFRIFLSMSRDKTVLHGVLDKDARFVPATGIRLFFENLL